MTPQNQAKKNPEVIEDTRLTRTSDNRVYFNPAVNTSRTLNNTEFPMETLSILQQILGHYRFAYRENPVGPENSDITEKLLGNNPKKIIFIATDSPALQGSVLVDQWGTPFFFHAMSDQRMDIRSAGPDKKMYTEDDLFLEGR